jgi:hypothetical protein
MGTVFAFGKAAAVEAPGGEASAVRLIPRSFAHIISL